MQWQDVPDEPETVVTEFRTRFYETELFFDRFARGKFAQYLFSRHTNPIRAPTHDTARRLIEEAQLFIEAAHACETRMAATVQASKN